VTDKQPEDFRCDIDSFPAFDMKRSFRELQFIESELPWIPPRTPAGLKIKESQFLGFLPELLQV
jgi:hypothetical protein